jgi:hypothetical protein
MRLVQFTLKSLPKAAGCIPKVGIQLDNETGDIVDVTDLKVNNALDFIKGGKMMLEAVKL